MKSKPHQCHMTWVCRIATAAVSLWPECQQETIIGLTLPSSKGSPMEDLKQSIQTFSSLEPNKCYSWGHNSKEEYTKMILIIV